MNNETTERAVEAYDMIDGYLRNNLDDADYADYSAALECVWARASAATQAVPEHIPATLTHDEGAFAQCGDCGRYSLDPRALTDRPPACECGSKTGWCGSFKKPGPHSRWSGAASMSAAAPVVPPVALPALTDEWLDEAMRLIVEFGRSMKYLWQGESYIRDADSKLDAVRAHLSNVIAASAAPAPEQMQPNAQDKGHLALSTSGAPCGDEAVEPDLIETVRKALHRAYHLGQTYWAQADSESYAANKRSEETAAKMEQLSADTLAALSAVPPTVKE